MTEKLTIRDQFAMVALQGLLANTVYMGKFGSVKNKSAHGESIAKIYSSDAYYLADAMLEERK